MKNLVIVFVLFTSIKIYSQNFSKKKIENYVKQLTELSIFKDEITYEPNKNGDLIKKTRDIYWVNDNMTSHVISNKKWFSDNNEHTIFINIYRKGKISDFIIMTKSEFPNIRFYGFWALLINNNIELAKKIKDYEKENTDFIYWNSLGCEVKPIKSYDLMNDFIKSYDKKN